MSNGSKSSGLFWGWFLIALGALFLLDSFDVLDFGDLVSTFWPVILIVIGAKLILDKNKRPSETGSEKSKGNRPDPRHDNFIRESSLFGDTKLKVDAKEFAGGNVSTIFGDSELDLSEIDVKEGENIITLNGLFGDISVTVPKNAEFAVRANVILGDVQILDVKKGGFFVNKTHQSDGYAAAKKKLYISASQVFGDIVIQ